jgi:hypothetical protein
LELRDEDILHILKLADFAVSKSELGAIFRKEDHPNYMPCGDQLLRNFLNGLIIYKRGPMPEKTEDTKPKPAPKAPTSSPKKQLTPPKRGDFKR